MSWLRDRRTAAGMSQQKLADLIGTEQGYISLVENGRFKTLKRKTVENLAEAFGCTAAELKEEMEAEWGKPERKKKPEPGNWLKRRRFHAGMTQERLGQVSGVSRVYISVIECGHVRRIGSATMERLASAFLCSADELYAEFESQKAEQQKGK